MKKKPTRRPDTAPGTETAPAAGPPPGKGWTFLSNHSHVLVLLAAEPDLRLRDLAERVGITERAVQKIVADLEAGGVLTRQRDGRRNHYLVHRDRPLRHPVEAHRTVADLIGMVHG
ncbi:MAG: winged helix-turn-helix domain-containing protein [Planctomycetota bacterium]